MKLTENFIDPFTSDKMYFLSREKDFHVWRENEDLSRCRTMVKRWMPVQENLSLNQAKMFLYDCVLELGLGFHPDTNFDEYVNLKDKLCTFQKIESKVLGMQLSDAFNVFARRKIDIYGHCIELTENLI